MAWRDAVPAALRMLLQPDGHRDPHLELLRLGAEHGSVQALAITVTLVFDGALVTGTVIGTEEWERLHLRRLSGHSEATGTVLREALGYREEAGRQGRRRGADRRFLHLADVTHRCGRTVHTLELWRGPITAVSGWTLGEPELR